MFKRIGLIIGILLLSILLLGYIFRLPLLQWAIAPELKKAGITLSCLDFSMTSELNIHADKVCVNYQNQQLQLTDITANTKRVDIENAVLTVNSLPKSDNANQLAKNLDLALPSTRPLINIKQLVIKSDEINKPLKIRITEPELNQFNVEGDINASAVLANNKINGQFEIDDTLLKQRLNYDNTILAGADFNTQQAFSFDGIELELNGDISAQLAHTYEQCQFNVLTTGKLVTRFNLNSKALMLDTNLLNNKINLTPSCTELIPPSEYSGFVSEQVPLNWQLNLPQSIRLEGNELKLPMANLVSEGNKQFDILMTDSTLNITSPLEDLQTNLSVEINTPDINNINVNARLVGTAIKGDYAVSLESLPEFAPATANGLSIKGHFDISEFIDSKPVGLINAKLTLNNVDAFDISAVQYQGDLTARMDKQLNAEVTLTQQSKSAQYKDFKITDISNTLTANANLGVGELFTVLTAKTTIKAVNSPDIKLNNIKVESTGLQSRALQATHHVLVDDIEFVINHHVSAQAHPFEVIIPEQSVLPLNVFINQFEPLAKLTEGEFNGYFKGDVNLQHASFTMDVSHISALYNDYLVSDLNNVFNGQYNSGQLNIKPTTFNLNEFRAGAVVKEITGQWQVSSNTALINDVKGSVFGGEFSLDAYTIGKPNQVANVKFENIDASKLIALDEKSGIELTGRLAGLLPVHFKNGDVKIIDGSLFGQGTGNLKITNNAAFDSVMQQQQELQPVLGLLTNLDIQKLNSSVALKKDGWLTLGVNLQGYNKAQQQPVNFNYNHEENIFTLLRALRLSDEITQKVEQQYSQKGN